MLLTTWARNGLSYEQIAYNMNIAQSTLFEYMKKFTEISEALTRAREVADAHIENALYKSAHGFTQKEKKVIYEKGVPHVVEVETYYPPNHNSLKLWLTNRRKENWRNSPDTTNDETLKKLDEVLGKIGGNI